jgi:chemotaxis protein methyltransferase CheR
MVSFARHNLVGVWQMSGPMQVIFCRNVLLYFDRPTQRRVIAAFHDILTPGGYLYLGATETVSTGTHFQYLQPSVYRRPL